MMECGTITEVKVPQLYLYYTRRISMDDLKLVTKTSHTQNGLRTLKIQYFS